MTRAFAMLPTIQRGDDLAVVVSPFQLSNEEVRQAATGKRRVLSVHMEDPYALSANIDRVQTMASCAETWVCTNDAATMRYYRPIVGDRVIVCSSLSPDCTQPVHHASGDARDIDVLLCGYAYPSRRRFVEALLPMLRGLKVRLVGDGWAPYASENVKTQPTQPLRETYDLHGRARAVVCLQRVHGDCSDGPVEPATLNRGFMEGYSGPRVFVDRSRPRHSLDEGDVVWYHGPGDLAGMLRTYLAGASDPAAARFATKCRTLYTYRTRLLRAINCVTAPRYLAEIP